MISIPAICCTATQTFCVRTGLVQSAEESGTNVFNIGKSLRPVDVYTPYFIQTLYNCSRLVVSVRLLCIASIAASNFCHAVSSKSAGIAGLTKPNMCYVLCAGVVRRLAQNNTTCECFNLKLLFITMARPRMPCVIRHKLEGRCNSICHEGLFRRLLIKPKKK